MKIIIGWIDELEQHGIGSADQLRAAYEAEMLPPGVEIMDSFKALFEENWTNIDTISVVIEDT